MSYALDTLTLELSMMEFSLKKNGVLEGLGWLGDLGNVKLLFLFAVEGFHELAPAVEHEEQALSATWLPLLPNDGRGK